MSILEYPAEPAAARQQAATTHAGTRESWWNEVGEPAEIGVSAYRDDDTAPVVVAIGCAGGRHRSVVLARALGQRLAAGATGAALVQVVHRDVTEPVVRRDALAAARIGGAS